MADYRKADAFLTMVQETLVALKETEDAALVSPDLEKNTLETLDFQKLHNTFENDIVPLLEKLETRSRQIDPISKKTIYGPKMQAKVAALLLAYDAIPALLATRAEECRLHLAREKNKAMAAATVAAASIASSTAFVAQQSAATIERLRQETMAQEAASTLAITVLAETAEASRQARRIVQATQAAEQRAEQHTQEVFNASILAAGESSCLRLTAALQWCHLSMASASLYDAAVELLLMFVTNIVQHPETDLFRRIKLSNKPYHEALGQYHGGDQCLVALGFQLQHIVGEDEEKESTTEKVMTKRCKDGLLLDPTQDQDQALMKVYVLEEPDLAVDLDRWSDWFDDLKATQEYLQTQLTHLKR